MEGNRITALRQEARRGKRINVFLDGKLVFRLEPEVAAREGLYTEQVLSAERTEALGRANNFQRCLNAALGYLGYRPRSEAELRQRLARKGFSPDIQNAVISKLTEQRLLNDTAFAQFWKDSRETFRPRSRRLVKLELRHKGVSDEIIDRVVNDIDEEASAHQAALSKIRRLSGADYATLRRRLGGYLQRRGFSASVIRRTLEKVWADEMGQNETSQTRSVIKREV